MPNTDTPITDEAEDRCSVCGITFVNKDTARRLERERGELIKVLERCLEPTEAQTKWGQARALLATLKERK